MNIIPNHIREKTPSNRTGYIDDVRADYGLGIEVGKLAAMIVEGVLDGYVVADPPIKGNAIPTSNIICAAGVFRLAFWGCFVDSASFLLNEYIVSDRKNTRVSSGMGIRIQILNHIKNIFGRNFDRCRGLCHGGWSGNNHVSALAREGT